MLLVVEVGGLIHGHQQPGRVEHEEGGDGGDEDHGEATVLALLVSSPLSPELHGGALTTHGLTSLPSFVRSVRGIIFRTRQDQVLTVITFIILVSDEAC